MQQYIDLCARIDKEGIDVVNDRTGAICRTIISHQLRFDCRDNKFSPVTVRTSPRKLSAAELLGYWKGCRNAKQFRELGTRSWDANANLTESWLNNPVRKGEDDLGVIYGAVANRWPVLDSTGTKVISHIDLFRKVYNNLSRGIDDRGEIVTYWNPGTFHNGALRPCLHTMHYSLLGGMLHVDAQQRSADTLIGTVANINQVQQSLIMMAHITGHKPGFATLNMVNAHFYGNQIDIYRKEQVGREPIDVDMKLHINPRIKTWDDVVNTMTTDDFIYTGEYKSHPQIAYPFQE